MPVEILHPYTQLRTDINLLQPATISLRKPSPDRVDAFRNRYGFSSVQTPDSSADVIGRDGRFPDHPERGTIQELGVLISVNRAATVVLGVEEDPCIDLLEDILQSVYECPRERLASSVDYITNSTTTKAKFSTNLMRVFNPGLTAIFHDWEDLETGSLMPQITDWPPPRQGIMQLSARTKERFYGKGSPNTAFVVPSDLDFFVYIPTRYYKMTKYRLRLWVESFEDYLENEYFTTSEMPLEAHRSFLEGLDRMAISG